MTVQAYTHKNFSTRTDRIIKKKKRLPLYLGCWYICPNTHLLISTQFVAAAIITHINIKNKWHVINQHQKKNQAKESCIPSVWLRQSIMHPDKWFRNTNEFSNKSHNLLPANFRLFSKCLFLCQIITTTFQYIDTHTGTVYTQTVYTQNHRWGYLPPLQSNPFHTHCLSFSKKKKKRKKKHHHSFPLLIAMTLIIISIRYHNH